LITNESIIFYKMPREFFGIVEENLWIFYGLKFKKKYLHI